MAFGDFGSSYPSTAPGSAFHQWDAVSKRRFNVSGGQRPSWDTPAQSASGASLPPSSPAMGAPLDSGSMIGDWTRNTAMADSGSRINAGRTAAMVGAGNDPSLAAYGGLNALLSGQGETARASNAAQLGWTQHLADQAEQERQMRLRYKLEEEAARKAASGAWAAAAGGLVGKVGGAWLSPGGIWAGKSGGAKE
jgi:hypothetical protein